MYTPYVGDLVICSTTRLEVFREICSVGSWDDSCVEELMDGPAPYLPECRHSIK